MKVLGIGNALVDILIKVEDEQLLQELSLEKGVMQLIDKERKNEILKKIDHLNRELSSGGSAANTIHGLAHLGLPCSFIGKVGKDKYGDLFRRDLEQNAINPLLLTSQNETGVAITFITPDSERTFATFLGAAVELSASDLDEALFNGYEWVHIEGYLVQNRELIEKALSLAKKKGLKTSLDLANFFVVKENKDFLDYLISQYVDVVFANEDEARTLTGAEPEDALHILSGKTELSVVKLGAHGSLVKQGNRFEKIAPRKAKAVDTTGAGDIFASGFIFGLTRYNDLQKAGEIGSVLGGKVVEVIGAKLNDNHWKEIKKAIDLP